MEKKTNRKRSRFFRQLYFSNNASFIKTSFAFKIDYTVSEIFS